MAEVYAIGFPNGKLYVGITSRSALLRFRSHKAAARGGSGYAVHRALRKYGAANCRLMVLAHDTTMERAKELETQWIADLATGANQNGYNMTAGGDGTTGLPASKKTRNAVSNRMRQAWQDPEFRRARLADLARGRDRMQTDPVSHAKRATASKANAAKAHAANRGRPTSELQKKATAEANRRRRQTCSP